MLTKSQDAKDLVSPFELVYGKPNGKNAEVLIVSTREDGTLFR